MKEADPRALALFILCLGFGSRTFLIVFDPVNAQPYLCGIVERVELTPRLFSMR
jgi:hypothetical protein